MPLLKRFSNPGLFRETGRYFWTQVVHFVAVYASFCKTIKLRRLYEPLEKDVSQLRLFAFSTLGVACVDKDNNDKATTFDEWTHINFFCKTLSFCDQVFNECCVSLVSAYASMN